MRFFPASQWCHEKLTVVLECLTLSPTQLAFFAVLALLMGTSFFRSSSSKQAPTTVAPTAAAAVAAVLPKCPSSGRQLPRVVSHRGVDEDQFGGPAPTTTKQLRALLDEGFGSFDLDLFWAANDAASNLFIGHPPSLRALWGLEHDVVATPMHVLAEHARAAASRFGARDSAGGGAAGDAGAPAVGAPVNGPQLVTLAELSLLLASRRAGEVGTVSLELKFPAHAEWPRHLDALYAQLRRAGAGLNPARPIFALVVADARQADLHRAAQAAYGISLPTLLVVPDAGATRGIDGEPHANLSALAAGAGRVDAWSASVRLLEPSLRELATRTTKPLAVWTVDTEEALRRAYIYGADDVVTNRPRWARRTLELWREECEQSHVVTTGVARRGTRSV